MGKASQFIPALKYGHKIYPEDMASPLTFGDYWYVDADNGSDSANTGKSINKAKATIQAAVTAAGAGDVIFVKAKAMGTGATDPESYAETVSIPAATDRLSIVGVTTGRTQGGLPQIRKGSGSTALLTIRAPGCLVSGIGFNGASATGGGILLDDDGSTKTAFGTTIEGCHFKNCKGSTATDSRTGGAIQWSSAGGAWQSSIINNQFYKNVGDVVLLGTGGSVPQDVLIEGNRFLGLATSVDCHLYLAAGSGMASVLVHNNVFADVLPALGSGSVVRYVDMTGCTGIFSDNYVGGSYTTTGFGAAKAAAKIPTTVGITHCYSDAGLIVREA
jgi:hypothetical protein